MRWNRYALAAMFFITSAEAAPDVKIDISAAEILKAIGSGIGYVLNKYDMQHRESVGQLSMRLFNLAGAEQGLARTLSFYLNDPTAGRVMDPNSAVQNTYLLNSQISEIKGDFVEIQESLRNLDPNWAAQNPNPSLISDIGSFAHDGMLFYISSSRHIPLTDQKSLQIFIANLQSESTQIKSLALALNKKITEPNANLTATTTQSNQPALREKQEAKE